LYRCRGTCLADELADIAIPRVAKRDRLGQVAGKVGSAVGDADEIREQVRPFSEAIEVYDTEGNRK